MSLQEFAEQESLSSQPIGAFIGRKEVTQLIAKDGSAARLQHHHRYVRVDLTAEKLQDASQIFLRLIEHPEIVERPSATKMLHRHRYLKSSLLEHFQRRSGLQNTRGTQLGASGRTPSAAVDRLPNCSGVLRFRAHS